MDYGWFVFIGFIVIMAVIVLIARRRNFTKVEKFTSTNTQRNANFLPPRYADEKDDPIAFNDAFNFHDDCGDR